METRKKRDMAVMVVVALAGLAVLSLFGRADKLEPDAPPGPTMHTLEDIYGVCSSLVEPAAPVPQGPVTDAAFVKFQGIDGQSTDPQHLNWCDLTSFSMGASSSGSYVAVQDVSLTKVTDKATPKLIEALCTIQDFPTVEIHLTTSFESVGRVTYYKYELKDATVTSVAMGGSVPGDGPLIESITLCWDELKVTYTEYKANGTPLGNVEYTIVNPSPLP